MLLFCFLKIYTQFFIWLICLFLKVLSVIKLLILWVYCFFLILKLLLIYLITLFLYFDLSKYLWWRCFYNLWKLIKVFHFLTYFLAKVLGLIADTLFFSLINFLRILISIILIQFTYLFFLFTFIFLCLSHNFFILFIILLDICLIFN